MRVQASRRPPAAQGPRRAAIGAIALALVCGAATARAQERDSERALQQALYQEQVTGELQQALTRYRALADGRSRHLAAARLGVARCLRRLGQHAEALRALNLVLSEHGGPPSARALALIRDYERRAASSMVRVEQLESKQAEMEAQEQRLRDAQRELAQTAADKLAQERLRSQVERDSSELAALRAEVATLRERANAAKTLRSALADGRAGDRQRAAREIASGLLDEASELMRAGDAVEAMRRLQTAKSLNPHDPRAPSLIATLAPTLSAEELAKVEALRGEADQLALKLDAQLQSARAQVLKLQQLANSDPLEALAQLRSFLRGMPPAIAASSLGREARVLTLELMTALAGVEAPRQLPGTEEQLASYLLPEAGLATPLPGGGLRELHLDRQLERARSAAFFAPSPTQVRGAILRQLASLVDLDDPSADSAGVTVDRQLTVVADPATQRRLALLMPRLRQAVSRVQEVQVLLMRYAPDADEPWRALIDGARAQGDGAYAVLDESKRRALEQRLARAPLQRRLLGPLRLWSGQPALLSASGEDVYVIGYSPRAAGAPRPLLRRQRSGLELEMRAQPSPVGARLALRFASQRVRRPVALRETPSGPIQLPALARQRLEAELLVPADGALLLFGFSDPLASSVPRRLALLISVRALEPSGVDGQLARRFDLGPLAALPEPPPDDLGGRTPITGTRAQLLVWLAAASPKLALTIDGDALIARGSRQELASLQRRLDEAARACSRATSLRVHLWSLPADRLALVRQRGGLQGAAPRTLAAAPADRLRAWLDDPATPWARRLPLPPGPYVGAVGQRLIASQLTGTRYLREVGPPARYGSARAGAVIGLSLMPDDRLDIRFQLAHLADLRPVQSRGGAALRPRRTLVSGQLAPRLKPGQAALLGGIRDPADAGRRLVLMVSRER